MSPRPTRRDIIKAWAAPALSLPFIAVRSPALAETTRQLLLPQGKYRLARTLRRSLFDGNEIRVTRNWHIRFEHTNNGVAITGEQVGVEVDAPPSLGPLIEIEQTRSTADMWPIELTPSGLIIIAGRGIEGTDLDEALRVARAMIAEKHGERTAQMLVRDLQIELARAGASMLDQLPDDLFFPSIGPISLTRQVALPDGQVGEFAMSYEALAVPGKGWLASADRQVTTRLAGTEQYARENWSLNEV